MDDPPESFPVRDGEDDVDIPVGDFPVGGAEIPEGQIVVQPTPEDESHVNGAVLRADSWLAALRAGCSFYGISSSGSKQKCFQRLLDHTKKLELEMVMSAAKEVQQQGRHPSAPVSAEAPSEWEQSQHRLTHIPFKPWLVLRTRQSMGLKTRDTSGIPYDKGNSLAENAAANGAASSAAIPMEPEIQVLQFEWLHQGSILKLRALDVRQCGESEEALKRQRTEDAKKQAIHQLKVECEERLSALKLAYKEYFAMDDFSTDLDLEEDSQEDDVWAGEEDVTFSGIPEALWSDADSEQRPGVPGKWVDHLAYRVETQRLCQMQVLAPSSEFEGEVARLKGHVGCGVRDSLLESLQLAGGLTHFPLLLAPKRQICYLSDTLERRPQQPEQNPSVTTMLCLEVWMCAMLFFRTILETENGLVLLPETSVEKVAKAFEDAFGPARLQKGLPAKTGDGFLQLKQVSTVYSVADLGTKTLARQLLFFLLHECGPVYEADLSPVGEREFEVVSDKLVTSKQIKKVSKASLHMGLAMGVSERLGPTGMGAAAQQCDVSHVSSGNSLWTLWIVIPRKAMEALSTRLTVFEEEVMDAMAKLEEAADCVLYGLMEFGGFVWYNVMDENTDAVPETNDGGEDAEEESPTTDEEETAEGRPTGTERLLQHMRNDQNISLGNGQRNDAAQIQEAIVLILEATSGREPEEMSKRVLTGIRAVFQRLCTGIIATEGQMNA
eukprot:s145_g2.t1